MAREQQNRAPHAQHLAPTAGFKPAAVVTVPAPEAVPPPQKPKSDRYRVKGPGGVFANGVLYEAGAEMQLSEADALSVIDAIVEI